MTQHIQPLVKQQIFDGNAWFSNASENWVKNLINKIQPCKVATVDNLIAIYDNGTSGVGATLTNSDNQEVLVIDGITLSIGDRVLVKNQTTSSRNGIYEVTDTGSISTDWVLTRTNDYDDINQILTGDIISVIGGTANTSSLWMLTSNVTTIGTSDLIFGQTDRNTFTSILGTPNQIVVDIVNGVATISVASNPRFSGTAAMVIPTGTLIERPAVEDSVIGMVRNTIIS